MNFDTPKLAQINKQFFLGEFLSKLIFFGFRVNVVYITIMDVNKYDRKFFPFIIFIVIFITIFGRRFSYSIWYSYQQTNNGSFTRKIYF